MAIKMLISDLDGTLLGADSHIAPRTAEVLKKAHKAGLHFLVATGRAWSTASPLLKEANVDCDFILLNGAEYRNSEGKILRLVSLSINTVLDVIKILKKHHLDFEINADSGDFVTDTTFCIANPLPNDIEDFFATNPKILKIFAFSHNVEALKLVRDELKAISGTTVTASAHWNIEITASEAQKGICALWAMSKFGLTSDEVMVFGDGHNDMGMFKVFEHNRAMGNAVDELKAMAEYVIGSNVEYGVAKEVERLLKAQNNLAS